MGEAGTGARALASWGLVALAAGTLALHARHFDFVCDDAFIALRQAQNLALHGAPVYDLGERVEAATSPAWVLLLAIGLRLHAPPIALLQGLALAGGVLLVLATLALARQLLPRAPVAHAFVLGALVVFAPVGAWSSGGLETPLFAASLTFALARLDVLERTGTPRAAWWLGGALAVACLVRLEALLAFAIVTAVALAQRRIARDRLGRVCVAVLVPMAALTLFRLGYYGLPLPHSFYAKTASVGRIAMIRHGLTYARFALGELGAVQTLLLCASPILLSASRAPATVWVARCFVPAYVAYVVLVGGDFLDLFRFFVPLLPITLVTFAATLASLLDRYGTAPALRLVVGLVAFVPHAARQIALSKRSLAVTDLHRTDVGIEPLGWTKQAAQRWSLVGRWLASAAEPGDTMASGAAGALPYFAGLPNYDLLGIASPEVIREGRVLWVRPGHTRIASIEQVSRRAPSFLFASAAEGWAQRGYDEVRVRLDEGSTTSFFVRRDRVARLLGRADVERTTPR